MNLRLDSLRAIRLNGSFSSGVIALQIRAPSVAERLADFPLPSGKIRYKRNRLKNGLTDVLEQTWSPSTAISFVELGVEDSLVEGVT